MTETNIRFADRISKKKAIDKICAHARFGNHCNSFRPSSCQELQKYLIDKGVNTDKLAEECRNPNNAIPEFENLARSTWHSTGKVALIDAQGDVVQEMGSPGLFVWSNYEAHFEAACEARDRAVSQTSYSAFQDCLSQGFASIEAFLTLYALGWNKEHPEDQLVDDKQHKTSLDDKLDVWVTKISNGGKIDKDNIVWNEFKKLKGLRDDNAIHPKLPGQCIEYKDFAKQLNMFRLGIAQLLANIHVLFRRPVPGIIINAIYMPDVEVVEINRN